MKIHFSWLLFFRYMPVGKPSNSPGVFVLEQSGNSLVMVKNQFYLFSVTSTQAAGSPSCHVFIARGKRRRFNQSSFPTQFECVACHAANLQILTSGNRWKKFYQNSHRRWRSFDVFRAHLKQVIPERLLKRLQKGFVTSASKTVLEPLNHDS